MLVVTGDNYLKNVGDLDVLVAICNFLFFLTGD